MSIEIIKENFEVEEVRGNGEIQALVETEVYLNTNKPDIENIIWVEGRVEILNTKIIKDKLLINGLVKFNLVYKSNDEENIINTMESQKDFKEEISIEGIAENMMCDVNANIEYIEYEFDDTKIQLKTLVNLFGEVQEGRNLEIIQGIEGRDDLQTLKENIKYNEISGRETSYANVVETVEIDDIQPAIERVIRFSVDAKEVETVVVEDRVILSGEATASMIYLGDNKVNSIKEVLPFNHFIEIPGAHKDSKGEVKLEVVEGIYEIRENAMGELKIIDLDIRIRTHGKVFDEISRDLIIDAYSTKEKLVLKREEINIRENIEEINYEDSLAFDLDIDAVEILDIKGISNIIDKRYLDGDIVVDGVFSVDVYYIDRISGEIANYHDHFPYKSNISFEGDYEDLIIDINHKLGDINYILKKDIMSIENSMEYRISLSNDKKIYGIMDIEETEEVIDNKNMASITVYIVQKGDILWDIAKRYNTTVEEILSSNSLDEDYEIEIGDKIIIEKKVDLDF